MNRRIPMPLPVQNSQSDHAFALALGPHGLVGDLLTRVGRVPVLFNASRAIWYGPTETDYLPTVLSPAREELIDISELASTSRVLPVVRPGIEHILSGTQHGMLAADEAMRLR